MNTTRSRRYDKMSPRERDLYLDLDRTELLYRLSKSKSARRAINNLRYAIIVELHRTYIVL